MVALSSSTINNVVNIEILFNKTPEFAERHIRESAYLSFVMRLVDNGSTDAQTSSEWRMNGYSLQWNS